MALRLARCHSTSRPTIPSRRGGPIHSRSGIYGSEMPRASSKQSASALCMKNTPCLPGLDRASATTTNGTSSRRLFSTVTSFGTVSKADIQRIISKPKYSATLIDVREPGEVQNTGLIPTAHNIPVGQILPAISLTAQEFQQKYGFPKPAPSDEIIVYCKSGVRAANVAGALVSKGFTKVKTYPGSANEWFQ